MIINSTAGGFGDTEEEDYFDDQAGRPGAPVAFGAEGEQDQSDNPALQAQLALQQRAVQAGAAAYGQNAAQRWSGTPAIGLSIFNQRDPLIATRLNQRGKPQYVHQIDASTHMATPPEGLIGGRALESALAGGPATSLTPEASWRHTFGGASGTSSPAGSRPGGAVPRAPILSRFGTSGSFRPSYGGKTLNPGSGYAY